MTGIHILTPKASRMVLALNYSSLISANKCFANFRILIFSIYWHCRQTLLLRKRVEAWAFFYTIILTFFCFAFTIFKFTQILVTWWCIINVFTFFKSYTRITLFSIQHAIVSYRSYLLWCSLTMSYIIIGTKSLRSLW